MVNRILALRLFEAFSIQRWNDRIRPIELCAMDMHAFKAVLTFIIGKIEEDNGAEIDWNYIIEGIVFGLLNNIALSDIKAQVVSKIKKEHAEQLNEINKWVIKQNKILFQNKGEKLEERFENFLKTNLKPGDSSKKKEDKILHAAQKISTYREFLIIKQVNANFPKIEEIENQLTGDLSAYHDLEAVNSIEHKKPLYNAICLIEQLRYQVRWSQTPRIPHTSVLGHSLYVALLSFFISNEYGFCKKRIVNNFYSALFHDIAESVTRDIISPVKRATTDLPKIVKKIEKDFLDTELYPNLPDSIVNCIKDFTGDNIEGDDEFEFKDRIIKEGKRVIFENKSGSLREINNYNKDEYQPIDGTIIKLCDGIAAFIEASRSIEYGITSKHLFDGFSAIRNQYLSRENQFEFDVQEFFLSFD
ncbi:MAG: HD domain-containing protein [Bacteroidetes bacterium]|nr:HD domain-containing protein [Bacteroidota bacterium]